MLVQDQIYWASAKSGMVYSLWRIARVAARSDRSDNLGVIRNLVRRYGATAVTVGMTVSSVLFAVLLLVILDLLLKGYVPAVDLVIVIIIPGIIAPVMTSRFIRLVQELDRAEGKLTELARRDALTGVYNRRYFLELAVREFQRSERYGLPLSLILLDVDNFKQINDTYGHAVGDEVLVNLAEILRSSLRGFDTLARYGGEEFVIMLPETSLVGAGNVAERIRRSVERAPADFFAELTISAGVSELKQDTAGLDDLLGQADRALYQAKEGGRNLVVLAGVSGEKQTSA